MRYIVMILIAGALSGGCNTQTTKTGAVVEPAATAKQLMANDDYAAAAQAYLKLAKRDKKNAGYYQLRAADAWLSANEISRAEEIIDAVTPKQDDVRTAYLKRLLQGKAALYQNQPKHALKLLAQEPPGEVALDIAAQTYLLRAQSYALLAEYLATVRERLQYQGYLHQPEAIRQNAAAIWSALNQLDTATLQGLRANSPTGLKSWIELALIHKTLISNPAVLRKSLLSWQQAHPEHAASPQIIDKLLQLSRQSARQPQQLALLLPLTGQYRKAAEAIRDGFLAAWYHSKTYRPAIRIYSADAINIRDVYNNAVMEGADFIIGPLEKQAVVQLIESGSLPITTQTLNQVDLVAEDNTGLLPNLIQFGLAPEDEARQAAERSFFDGHNKALVLTPQNGWGRRMAAAFKHAWQETGGHVLEEIHFPINNGDFANPVKRLLNIDSSERRAKKLQQIINRRIQREARLRQDADMIFLAAPPLYARQLLPQFRFHKADSLPVYSTSHIFSGIVNPEIDADMDGIRFTDIPWVLSEDTDVLKDKINRNWRAEKSPYRRLYALGIDSFNLIPHLSRLALEPAATYAGQTGILSMTDDGLIQRRLLWGRIKAGRPHLLAD